MLPTLEALLPARVWEKVALSAGCWEWMGSRQRTGYGQVLWDHRMQRAHRVVYEALRGPIPDGLDLDHLCRNRGCVNPDHLEPVTRQVNILRGYAARHGNRCLQGHPLDAANTIRLKNGRRRCRLCFNQRQREFRARRKAAA